MLITSLPIQEESRFGSISLPDFQLRRFVRLFPVQLTFDCGVVFLARTAEANVSECRMITAIVYVKNMLCTSPATCGPCP